MNKVLSRLLSKVLRETADKFDAGTCDLAEEEAIALFNTIAHISMSKSSAAQYLNVSRSTFDSLVSSGKLPKGQKVKGYKELRWYLDELEAAFRKY